jgi:hypothetical protein
MTLLYIGVHKLILSLRVQVVLTSHIPGALHRNTILCVRLAG